jgi:glyoxylase-like metal-dependent hydrolase (beta-lactamase superfamily II)
MKRVGFDWTHRGSCSHPSIMTELGGSLCPTDYPSFVGIIRHPEQGVILFDTGYDPAFFAATESFPERLYRWATPVKLDQTQTVGEWLAGLGIDMQDVTALVLSHFHGDHVAGLKNFPNAQIYCAAAGLKQMQSGSRFGRVRQGLLSGLIPDDIATRAHFFEDAKVVTLPQAFGGIETGADLLGEGSLIAIELPGHCPGHWGLAFCSDTHGEILLIGDAAWSIGAVHKNNPPPNITTALLGNTRRYRATLAHLQNVCQANQHLIILPSHCPVAAKALAKDGS